jgi:hypothetical protein
MAKIFRVLAMVCASLSVAAIGYGSSIDDAAQGNATGQTVNPVIHQGYLY